jgi:Uma2 family endonuclease
MNVEVKYTYEDLLSSPNDGHQYEAFEGELIMTRAPNRAHQKAHVNLIRILADYVVKRQLSEIYSAPFDVYFDDETVVQPDILFIAEKRLHIIDNQKGICARREIFRLRGSLFPLLHRIEIQR